ncbi:MAG: hypothetical protein A2Y33_09010 [Spirochaetes bacterium GWF1_51_8]|nr:MAG: hypothetical protein A2Y33_09010 [Spirochaetes bacterium GWF1_51_8]
MAITIEFWRSRTLNTVCVNFNECTYLLRDFLLLDDAKIVVKAMYKKIERDFPLELNETVFATVGEFIKKHFLVFDKNYDVVILGEGPQTSVIFNIEENKP